MTKKDLRRSKAAMTELTRRFEEAHVASAEFSVALMRDDDLNAAVDASKRLELYAQCLSTAMIEFAVTHRVKRKRRRAA